MNQSLNLDLTIPDSLIIAGSRTTTEAQFRQAVRQLEGMPRPTLVISGGNRGVHPRTKEIIGADYWGERWARSKGIEVRRCLADWDNLGLKAGPIRNRQMAELGAALFALWDGKSVGTMGMIHEMKRHGKPATVFRIPTPGRARA